MVYDVIIIGAGTAGLFAALELTNSGQYAEKQILILEASNRIGGRVHTIYQNQRPLELGAQYLHGQGENPLWKRIQNLNIGVQDVYTGYRNDNPITSSGIEVPLEIFRDTINFLEKIHEYCNIFAEETFEGKIPESIGGYFNEQFYLWQRENQFDDQTKSWQSLIFDWFKKWEEVHCGCETLENQSSISWGKYIDYEGQDKLLTNGFKEILDIVYKQIQTKITTNFNVEVQSITLTDTGSSIIKCVNGDLYTAEHVIITVSLGVLKANPSLYIHLPLSTNKLKAIETISFGVVNKIFLTFSEAFWLKTEKFKAGINIIQKSSSDWWNFVMGFDVVLDQPNTLLGWINGTNAINMEKESDEFIGEVCQKIIKDALPNKQNIRLVDIMVTRWHSNEYFRGSYSHLNPDCDKFRVTTNQLAEPIVSKVHYDKPIVCFAGEATDNDHYGTVDGAMTSGIREARKILNWKNNNTISSNSN